MAVVFDRRHFSGLAAAAACSPAPKLLADSPGKAEVVSFFLVGDTHFLAQKDAPAKLDERSSGVTSRLVDTLNRLPGTPIPAEAGGGAVLQPRGLIHAGDCIDTGDKSDTRMQQTEWAAFIDSFGLNGRDGRLKMPIYEVHGNHDSPRGDGLVVQGITRRNKDRPNLAGASAGGPHYSWDWGPVHCVNLGIVVGRASEPGRKRRYNPMGSLDFLISDLRDKVGSSGRPVVITHHVDMLRYALPLPVEDKKAMGMEWDPADVRAFHQALKGYNIAAVLYGHTHARNVFRWDGSNKSAGQGIPVFNVDNSSHFAGTQQAFFYFELHPGKLIVREYQTKDQWQTGSWTPQVWSLPVPVAAG